MYLNSHASPEEMFDVLADAGNDYETAHLNVAKGAELAHKNPGAGAPQYGAPSGRHTLLFPPSN